MSIPQLFSSLRARLVVAVLVVQALLLGMLIYEHVQDLGERLQEQATLRAQQLTVLLNASLSVPLIQADFAAAQEVLDETQKQGGLSYLKLTDLRGRLVAESGGRGKFAAEAGHEGGGGVEALSLEVPISMAGQQLGVLYFQMPLGFLESAKQHALWDSLAIGLVAMLVSAVVLAMLTVWITRRLGQLTAAADKVAAGDYDLDLPLGHQDEVGRAIVAFKQMTESIRVREEELRESRNYLLYLAERDSLTGLYNRHFFRHELQRRLDESARSGIEGALLLFDLDEFKLINDSFGHQVGDELLITIANEVGHLVRRNETFCRLGGDEFVLIAHSASESEIEALADRIVSALGAMRYEAGGQPVRLSCSMGVALYPSQAQDPETLLACADAAMYQAKQQGKNTWQLYRPERDSTEAHLAVLTWKERINVALEAGQFRLVYQGVYAMPKRRLAHVEALLRMYDEDSGRLITPNHFIPIAERSGQILEIDRWVIRECIRQLRLHPAMPPIAINVSGRSFDDPTLPGFIAEQLRVQEVEPKRLVVELTETAALSDMADAERFIRELRDLGCHICLDDFGAGFASFAYLKHIAADTIKIDGMFIRDLPKDAQSQVFVKAMIEVARGLGVTTIAECVEDEATLAVLRKFGVDYVQGYHLGRPQADHTALG
ncbi:MAG: EAL domain-containing protein [Hydrogenophilaceae bacterium]|nr:EAL domain-containing protein [Hydrogenophilaceae bacterium]